MALLCCLIISGGPLDVVRCHSEESSSLSISLMGNCTCCNEASGSGECTAHLHQCAEATGSDSEAMEQCSGCQDEVVDQLSPTAAARGHVPAPTYRILLSEVPAFLTHGLITQGPTRVGFCNQGPAPPRRQVLRI
jgi:hypothetical protein